MNHETNELRNFILNGTELKKLMKLNNFDEFKASIKFIINLLDELCIIRLNYNTIQFGKLYQYFKLYEMEVF